MQNGKICNNVATDTGNPVVSVLTHPSAGEALFDSVAVSPVAGGSTTYSIGATSTGLLLLRMADPDGKTPVMRDFTFKQIFHVMITGT